MTLRLSAMFEEHMKKIFHNWKRSRQMEKKNNKVSAARSNVKVGKPAAQPANSQCRAGGSSSRPGILSLNSYYMLKGRK